MATSAVFLGINGNAICVDRTTGDILWATDLKGTDFVNLVLDGDLLIATTKGEVWGLDPATGAIRWHNELKGQGRGLVTIATASGVGLSAPLAEKRRRDEQAAAAATGAAVASS
jgi:outer membrane protein assembly factor BamB